MDALGNSPREAEDDLELEVPGPEVRELFGLAYPDIAEFANMLLRKVSSAG